jgi:hypothetical protein
LACSLLSLKPVCYFFEFVPYRYSLSNSYMSISGKSSFRKSCQACVCLALAIFISGCGKPVPDTVQDASAAKPVAQTSPAKPAVETAETDAAQAAVRILHAAHRNGAVILSSACGPSGTSDPYPLRPPVKLEPMNDALQEISAKYQNIYWRESRETGVRVVDNRVKAKLLKIRLREFRIVEDREPDAALAALWRAPEVAGFLRKNHIRMPRRIGTPKKAISPPMIIEMKNAMVADILDRIAAGYRTDPPKVWIYRECVDKKETVVDVQMR